MKTVILVRHAQYSRNPEKLTALGLKQAKLTARILKATKADQLISSTMPRAIQTAQIIGKSLKLKLSTHDLFRESSLPVRNEDFEKVHGTKLSARERRQLQIESSKNQQVAERAFKNLFKKAGSRNQTLILVSHGNVIRYWVCRALGIDIRKWLLMDIHQCSITTIQVHRDGEMKVLGFSDVGHVPIPLRTHL
jgi:serine/threonine-protein phosphatase PGAM5